MTDSLSVLAEQGLIPNASSGRSPRNTEVPEPHDGEVVVFEGQLECGLRLPYSEFLDKLEVQHISPNSFVRLSTFEWALRSTGYSTTSARTFAHLHTIGVLTKKADFLEGSLEVQYGNTLSTPRRAPLFPPRLTVSDRPLAGSSGGSTSAPGGTAR